MLRGFEDDGTARDYSRRHLTGRLGHRKVPGNNLSHDADRVVHRVVEHTNSAAAGDRDRLPGELRRPARKVAKGTLQAWSGTGTPTITAPANDGIHISGNFIILDGIRFDGSPDDGIETNNGASDITIRNCIVSNNTDIGIQIDTGSNFTISNNTITGNVTDNGIEFGATPGGTLLIEKNTIDNNGNFGIILNGPSFTSCTVDQNVVHDNFNDGFRIDTQCTITSNVVYNSPDGIWVSGDGSIVKNNLVYDVIDDGIELAGASNCVVQNNTVDNAVRGVSVALVGSGNVVTNNILSNNTQHGLIDFSNTNEPVHSYNLYFNNTVADCGQVTAPCPDPATEITLDPLYVNRPGKDFHLSHIVAGQGSNSPAIDAGSDTAFLIGLDNKSTRTDFASDVGTVDMGYHYPGGVPNEAPRAWWDTDWLNRKRITFDNSGQSENLTNFPVLVKLDSANFDYSKTQAGGIDIRFVDADDATVLDYEIEFWDDPNTSYIWVRVPQIQGSSASDFIYIYYNNSTVISGAENPAGVWSNGYESVYHLHNDFADASGTQVVGTNNGTVDGTTTRLAGDYQTFDASQLDYIDLNWTPGYPASGNFTWSGWINVPDIRGSDSVLGIEDRFIATCPSVECSEIRLTIRENAAGQPNPVATWAVAVESDLGAPQLNNNTPLTGISNTGWHFLAVMRDGSTARTFLDGVPVHAGTISTGPITFP